MLGVLQEIFSGHTVIAQLGIPGQLLIFVDDLLRRTAHLALWARAVKHPIDDIANRAVAIAL